MSKLYIEDRSIVIPGDLLAEGMDFLPSGKSFREGDKLFASTTGLVSLKGHVIKVIPLAGKYLPKIGDLVIAKVTGLSHSGWQLYTNSPYLADMSIYDASSKYVDTHKAKLTDFFNIDDYVLTEIIDISDSKYIKLSAKNRPCTLLTGGNIIFVSPTKIPRIIGKQGSMIKLLQTGSGCDIVVGQNGLVWIKGTAEKEALAAQAIQLIEKESHKTGLTDKISGLLKGV